MNEPETASPEEIRVMRDLFALLLKAFSVARARSGMGCSPQALRVHGLLDGFMDAWNRSQAMVRVQAAGDHAMLRSLLTRYGDAAEKKRRQQEERADAFNLLEVMQLTGKEIRHSMVLAWLLDRDMDRLGTHAQGNLGFRLFLTQIGLPAHYADSKYWVRREVAGDDSVVDIEVACRGHFVIHIENKIWASEGTDQTDREWNDLRGRAMALGLNPDAENAPVHALFLTPDGRKATNSHFRSIRWNQAIQALEAFAEQAKPAEVKLFAAHYARVLRRFIVTPEIGKDEHGERTNE